MSYIWWFVVNGLSNVYIEETKINWIPLRVSLRGDGPIISIIRVGQNEMQAYKKAEGRVLSSVFCKMSKTTLCLGNTLKFNKSIVFLEFKSNAVAIRMELEDEEEDEDIPEAKNPRMRMHHFLFHHMLQRVS